MSRSARLQLKNKRKPNALEAYLFDRLVMAVAFIEPLTTSTQIYQIWKARDAAGNSLATWGFYTFSAIVWLVYGLRIKNKPLIVSSLFWLMANATVVAEILYFR